MRDDLHGERRAPKELTEYLASVGGKNIYGEPNYRLVWAGNVMRKEGGLWSDWPENASLAERGGLLFGPDGELAPSTLKPIRTVDEVRLVHKYIDNSTGEALEGWIVERWYPAHLYGNPDQWYSHRAPGSIHPILGPYPDRGMYENCSQEQLELPTKSELLELVQHVESLRENVEGSVAARVAKRIALYENMHDKRQAKRKQEALLKIRDRMSAVWGSSLGAGRLRNEIAERAGLTSHVGN
jgi:hypothetical protein